MKYYKLKNIRSPMVFSIEEIDTILKYRFNAQVCSRSLIHKSYLEKGVKDRTYRIKDLNVIEEMRLPEEREQIRNTLSEMTALGLEIQAMDKGEEYFIYLEFDVENRIVNTIVMGQECRYLLDEITILQGNDYEKDEMYLNCATEESKAIIEKVIQESKVHYMKLLKEHGYI